MSAPRYPQAFELVWESTGRRGTKFKAHKAWKVVGCPTWDAIRAAWLAYMASDRPAAGYVQDLSTWLRARGHQQEWEPARQRPLARNGAAPGPYYRPIPALAPGVPRPRE